MFAPTVNLLLVGRLLWYMLPQVAWSKTLSNNLFHKFGANRLGIINGQEVEENNEWPFMASIMLGHNHFCGGSVWNGNNIVTAAHCTFFENGTSIPAGSVNVYVGHVDTTIMDNTYMFKVTEMVAHEKYTNAMDGYDIAVFRLERSIDFTGANKGVKCVCQPMDDQEVIQDTCWVIGWGKTESSDRIYKLREVNVPLRDEAYCKKQFNKFDPSKMLCAGYDQGGKDACQGDSGGPLMCAITTGPYIYQLTGVVSWGKGCADVNSPGYYTKVSHYRQWIAQQTGC